MCVCICVYMCVCGESRFDDSYISSSYSTNSEASASELVEYDEEFFLLYYMDSDVV